MPKLKLKRLIGFLLLVGLDQGVKLVLRAAGTGQMNYGGAVGLFSGGPWLLGSLVGLVVLAWISRNLRKNPEKLAMVFVFAGGVSNIIDRLVFGGVWDFIEYSWFGVVVNIADIYLGIGVVILIWSWLAETFRGKKLFS